LSKPVKGAIVLSENAGNLRMAVEFLCSCCQAAAAGAASARLGQIPSLAEETGMAMQLGHVHIKTREDPQKVAKFYIDNFGATVKREIPGRGCQLDLHGVQLNVTTIIADQNHEQHVGIEHIAIETDDYAGALANFKKNGAQILEERVNNGRHVCWVAAPDGAQMELIEKV
jgi:predicted enzyme related to lactoylglutathione lyase